MNETTGRRLASVRFVLLALFSAALLLAIPSVSAASPEDPEEICMIPEGCPEGEMPEDEGPCMIEPWECGEEAPETCKGDRGRYIVVLHDWVEDPEPYAREQVAKYDGELGFIYRYALKGYSAGFPTAAIPALEQEPSVNYVEEDKPVYAASSHEPADECEVEQPEPPEEEFCAIPEGCPEETPQGGPDDSFCAILEGCVQMQSLASDTGKCGKGKVRKGNRCVRRRGSSRRACMKRADVPRHCLRR